jgi:hypothetical protein
MARKTGGIVGRHNLPNTRLSRFGSTPPISISNPCRMFHYHQFFPVYVCIDSEVLERPPWCYALRAYLAAALGRPSTWSLRPFVQRVGPALWNF